MTNDNAKWLFYLLPKDGGSAFEDVVDAKDLVEAVHVIDNTYGLELYEEFDIRRLAK
jgi:hypothetical protein